jgi:hypothetical protein
MFRNKRQGVELTVNTMILMAIGILILIIAAFMIMNTYNKSETSLSCEGNGNGKCQDSKASCPDDFPIPGPYSCSEGQKCCTNIGGSDK